MDPFKTLNVSESASLDEIKSAYRKLASKNHPDRGGDTRLFQEIQGAYDTLSDPEKRANYDMQKNMQSPFAGNYNPFQDFVNQFTRQASQKIYTVTVYVTLEQVANGSKENVQIQNGFAAQYVQLDVPQGLEDGQQYRFSNIMPDGWLQVTFKVHRHAKFERHGLDLTSTSDVNVFELITGTKIAVTDIFGNNLEIVLPAKTKPGTRMKIAGRGLKNSGRFGDYYVLLNAKIPDTISDKLTQAIREEVSTAK